MIAVGFDLSRWACMGASIYLVYGIVGALWLMLFVCPYCGYFATRACPCGYGLIAARLTSKGDRECFPEKFKRHIPVIVPLWLIPVACGGVALWHSFAWWLVALLAVFVVHSYVVLPLVSKRNCCAECPQADTCPWMANKSRSPVTCADNQQEDS